MSMDISDDSKLIVTCSADKNVKIWGLDFGDCHRSLFAHDDSVMQVAFERQDVRELDAKPSHYFWTVGKDKLLKYWDGDKVRTPAFFIGDSRLTFIQFENIQKLEGHHGEIWALAVSNHGKFVVTGSHDKSIRVWEKLDEPVSDNPIRFVPSDIQSHDSSSWKKNANANLNAYTKQASRIL